MNRTELEHLIRAAGAITGAERLVIVGSQAILGAHPDSPAELLVSQEADMYPLENPAGADLIDGSIGELSPFHEQFGYYAHGVGPETAVLPSGWRDRLVAVRNENTGGVTGLCLSPADLAVSKIIAGREKDTQFAALMLRERLVSTKEIEELISELSAEHADRVRGFLSRHGCRSTHG